MKSSDLGHWSCGLFHKNPRKELISADFFFSHFLQDDPIPDDSGSFLYVDVW